MWLEDKPADKALLGFLGVRIDRLCTPSFVGRRNNLAVDWVARRGK